MQLVDFAIRRRVTIAMATVAVALLGGISLSRLKVNLLPDLSYPTLTIRTELPGAAPLEVENLISRPIEEAAGVVRNVRTVRSISRSGQSDVVIEFLWGTDMDFAGIEVRERLDLLQLPLEATRPLLLRFDPSTEPVVRVAFVDTSATAGEERLKFLRRFADDRLKPEIESIEGSAAVKVSGGFEDEIHVYVDQERLAQLNLGIQVIAQRIGAENVNLSGGRLEQGTQRFLVRTVNEFESLEDMANSVIATVAGQPVYLKDVARVERAYKDRTAITRLNGRECIELAVYEEGDANTVQLANAVKERIETLTKTLPPQSELKQVYDQADFINSAIGDVRDAALWGGLLSVLVLYFFLRDARATIVTGIVIPVTVIGIFVLMYSFDLTLNIMSLGGIALSVGMLVDNSVVILESIARKREAGLGPVDAAREGTREVAMAVTASTLTSVAVFFPMVFVSGIAGQLFRDQALTVTFAQLLSLLVGLTLVPMLAARRGAIAESSDAASERRESLRERAHQLRASAASIFSRLRVGALLEPTHQSGNSRFRRLLRSALYGVRWAGTFLLRLLRSLADVVGKLLALLLAPLVALTQTAYGWLDRRYPSLLRWALAHRTLMLLVACAAFLLTVAALPRLGSELIPQLAQGEFSVKLRLGDARGTESGHVDPGPGSCVLRRGHRQPSRCEPRGFRGKHRHARRAPQVAGGSGNRGAGDPEPARTDRKPPRRAVRVQPPGPFHARHAGGGDPLRLRPRAARERRQRGAHPHGIEQRVPRRALVDRGRSSGSPDRVRSGARLAARADGARNRGSRRQQRPRRSRHALSLAGQEDRRARAKHRHARRIHR
jgi:HAE1 family hydrophobic/amphiphilic exporter-1